MCANFSTPPREFSCPEDSGSRSRHAGATPRSCRPARIVLLDNMPLDQLRQAVAHAEYLGPRRRTGSLRRHHAFDDRRNRPHGRRANQRRRIDALRDRPRYRPRLAIGRRLEVRRTRTSTRFASSSYGLTPVAFSLPLDTLSARPMVPMSLRLWGRRRALGAAGRAACLRGPCRAEFFRTRQFRACYDNPRSFAG